MVIDVNYYGPSSNVMVFYNHIDLKYLEKKNHNSNCFVVTTVMGDINHPVVEDFRRYRDNIILKSFCGMKFVEFYYLIGPYFSKIISNNQFLLKLSRLIVLKVHKKIK